MVSIISDPIYINPVGNPYWVIATSSNSGIKFNFRFNYDISLYGTTASTKKVILNPYNQDPRYIPLAGESDINNVIRDKFRTYQPVIATASGLTYSNDNYVQTSVSCIEVYSPNINQVPTVSTQSASTGNFYSINAYLTQDDYWSLLDGEWSLSISDDQENSAARLLTDRSTESQLADYNIISFICLGDSVYPVTNSSGQLLSNKFVNIPIAIPPANRPWDITNPNVAQFTQEDANSLFTTDILEFDQYILPGNHIKFRAGTEFTNTTILLYSEQDNFDFTNGCLKLLGWNGFTWVEISESVFQEIFAGPSGQFEYQIEMDPISFTLTEDYTKLALQIVDGINETPFKVFVNGPSDLTFYSFRAFQFQTNENIFWIKGYKNGNLSYVDSFLTGSGDHMKRMLMTNYYNNLDIDYFEVYVGKDIIIPNDESRFTNKLRLKNSCNSINNFEEITLIWMNSYGEWDSYTFMKLNESVNTTKTGIRKEFGRLSNISTQNYSTMNRNDILSFSVITKNLSISEFEYLQNILLTKEVYWINDGELWSVLVLTNEIQSKPINNVYRQLSLNVRLSQKLNNK